jgi:membrane peptidoglycan carboxypeptidase
MFRMRLYWLIGFSAGILLVAQPPVAGRRPVPTLAEDLQGAVDKAATRTAAIVVVDVTSASVLASRNMDVAAHRLARPGSTLKPFVLMELLETGKLEATTRVLCRHTLTIGTRRMDCSHPVAIAKPAAAIAYSCNTYVSSVATRLTGVELSQLLRRAGLDSRSSLMPDESTVEPEHFASLSVSD